LFVFYQGATAAEIVFDGEKFGIFCGNDLYTVIPIKDNGYDANNYLHIRIDRSFVLAFSALVYL